MLVMKFGGTSVADANAIKRVIKLITMRHRPKTVVVVSAIAEATNILTKVATLAAKNKLKECRYILLALKNRHLEIITNLIHNHNLLTHTNHQCNRYFAELEDLLKGAALTSELSDHCFAKIVAYGELLSSTILHAAMLEHNLENTLIDARSIIITDDTYQKGKPIYKEMSKKMPPLLNKYLDKNMIVLTQGFIAGTTDGETTILGREGSDYTASLIGMVMEANEIQIWTDVDGIMTADPRTITNTKFIPALSFQEAAELSYFGAKVIHPLTIEPATIKNIPVRILNSTNLHPKQKGTLITNNISSTKQTKIYSITYKENIKIINISYKHKIEAKDFLHQVFSVFNNQQITIDTVILSGTTLSLVPNQSDRLEKTINELASFATISFEEDKALICFIGKNLNNNSQINKITKNIYQVLNNYNIRMLVSGVSSTNLILVVPKNGIIPIVQKLHDTFFGKNKK